MTKANYVFPNFLAEIMKRVDQRTQYEATMLSLVFIMIGLTTSVIFTIFFTDFGRFIKIMAGANGVFAIMFLSSALVTAYQQYLTYMEAVNMWEEDE